MRFFERFTWLHVFIVSALVAVAVAVLTWFGRSASFTATSSLLLSDRPDIVSGMVAGSGQPAPGRDLDRLLTVLHSRSVRLALVERFNLAEKLELTTPEAVDMLAHMSSIKALGADGIVISVTCRGYRAPGFAIRAPLAFEDARKLCADLANAYIEQLRLHLREADVKHARQIREFLEAQHQELSDRLAATEDELEGLRRDYELVDPADSASRINERIRAVEQACADAAAEVSSARDSLRAAEARLDTVQARRISSEAQMRNPIISSLESRLAELHIKLTTELARGKTSENRDVQQIQAAIEGIEQQLADARETVLKEMSEQVNPAYDTVVGKVIEMHISLAGAQAREARYRSLLNAARAELASLPPVARTYVDITRRQELQARQLAAVEQALWQARVEEARATSTEPFSVLDEAMPPTRRRGPATLLSALIAFGALVLIQGIIIMDRRWFGG
ncbi:MAG: hypothetical protein J7M38_09175 [Armatimonadetes bacterium]|nr:hypothetical protein [Armatimonadota bacterium]